MLTGISAGLKRGAYEDINSINGVAACHLFRGNG